MVVLNINEIKLDDQQQHLATEYEVADNKAFYKPVLASGVDNVNLRGIVFNEILDPNIKYYGRARALLSTGWTIWCNIDVFIPKAIEDLNQLDELPTKVAIPVLVTTCNANAHDATLFNIYATGFSVVGTANHLSTSWFIEDMITGKIVWKRLEDDINKSSVYVNDIILEADRVYRIRAVFNTNSNDSSQISTRTIRIGSNSLVELSEYLDDINVANDNELVIGNIEGCKNVEWEILFSKDSIVSSIWYTTTKGFTATLPANTLSKSELYILRIKDDVSNLWKYYTFSTQAID